MSRFIIVGLADEHAGSMLGLCNPATRFDIEVPVPGPDGALHMEKQPWAPKMTPIMQAIWDKYLEGIAKAEALAAGDPIYIFKLGEVCEGTYFKNSSMELRKHYQVKIAVANMEPWKQIENIRSVRIVPGDRPHEFDEGSAANLVAQELSGQFPDVKVVCHGRWFHKPTGFAVDYAHRGPYPGSRKHLEGNIARLYLKDYMFRELIEFDRKPVDLLLRAHFHQPIEVDEHLTWRDGKYDSKLLVFPPLKLPDAYAKTVTGNKFSAAFGTTAIEVVDGMIKVHDNFIMLDVRNWEVVNE